MAKLPANRVLNGTYITLWWDNLEIGEVKSFEAKVYVDREEIILAGSNNLGSKIKSLKGEGTMKFHKVFTRGYDHYLKAYQKGLDPEGLLVVKWDDPDGHGVEKLVLKSVKFTELPLMNVKLGELGENEFPFMFDAETCEFVDYIKVES